MLASIIDLSVHILLCLLAVKVVFFRKSSQKPANVSWKSATEQMAIMEMRLNQIQERDMKLQERIWSLEDQNRDLQARLARATKEILLVRPNAAPSQHEDDDDDHDAMHSIPTN